MALGLVVQLSTYPGRTLIMRDYLFWALMLASFGVAVIVWAMVIPL